MPPYKEFTIRLKNAGIGFIALLITVEKRPESQLITSIKAKLTRKSITIMTVSQSQLADINDLSKKVLSQIQDAISRNII
ncbi:hypothetical protein NP493_489g03063 [Ridgeia piscesae]|uniref:Uncharacterized protein n=1 Tax=Ridgeia piscesae TaxID=27915 RepID=A0AAD9KXE9_RIDPI|nr:hypothetical protein NP493_489g03063 [Ridgeia piscesae]